MASDETVDGPGFWTPRVPARSAEREGSNPSPCASKV